MRYVEEIDRGGLVKINSKSFDFFQDLEVIVRKHLSAILNKQAISKKEIMENIMNDEDVLYI